MYKNGQIAIMDLLVAMIIFVIVFIFIMASWNNYLKIINQRIDYDLLQSKGFQVINILTKSQGVPVNWEEQPENVEVIGLAINERNISKNKLGNFSAISYDKIKELFNMENYNFYMILKTTNRENLTIKGNNSFGDNVVSLRGYVNYENKKAILEFNIWK